MDTKDFTTAILVETTAQAAFDAVNDVRGWWSEEIDGCTDKLNEVFNYHYEDVHRCKIKVTELIPGKKVVWDVLENYFKFTEDHTEWTGTKVIFDITEKGNQAEIRMTHVGLVPEYECYNICNGAWTNYIQNSLRSLVTTGKGMPNGIGKPQTEDEKKLAEK